MCDSSSSENQIDFNQEILRKATHMFALVIPGGYYLLNLTRAEMLMIMIPITLVALVIDISRLRQYSLWTSHVKKIMGSMVRQHEEEGAFTGASYILISVCLTVALFTKVIAIAAISFIIVGDTFAAIIGRKFGRHRFHRSKTVEGTLACLGGTLLTAMLVPDIALPVAVVGAVVATIIEAFPFGVDDNISVPLLSGLVMTLMTKSLTFL